MKKESLLTRLEELGLNTVADCEDYISLLFQLDREIRNSGKGDSNALHEKCKNLRHKIIGKMNDRSLSLQERYLFYPVYKKALRFDAYTDFDCYMQYLEYDREPNERFYLPRRNILLKTGAVQALQDLEDDKLDTLIISMPPGTGKTTCGLFFLSWVIGKRPNGQNLACSYAGNLAASIYEGVKTILTDPEYNWGDVFPGVNIQSQNVKTSELNLDKPNRFKTLSCKSIDGQLTGGTRCTDYLYVDDLVSGIEEAMSKDRMAKLWEKYTSDLKSRKKLGCKEIHIATRWSVNDPIGHIIALNEGNPRCRVINIPCFDDNGESNFNYDFGVGFDTEYFKDMERTMDQMSFKALFLGKPIEREGLLYNEDELVRYYSRPAEEPDAILCVCDTATSGTDYTTMLVGYQYGDKVYIDDVVFDNAVPDVTTPELIACIKKNWVQRGQFESNNAGWAICDKVQEAVADIGCSLTKKYTTGTAAGSKETKIIVNSTFVKSNFLFKDKTQYQPNSQYGRFIDAMLSYTLTGKNKHDDAVDALAMFALYIQSFMKNKWEVMHRLW